jgi:hypothetical protein
MAKTPTLATAAERPVRWAAILGVGAARGWRWGGVFVAQKPQPLPRGLNRHFGAGRPVTGGARQEERVREAFVPNNPILEAHGAPWTTSPARWWAAQTDLSRGCTAPASVHTKSAQPAFLRGGPMRRIVIVCSHPLPPRAETAPYAVRARPECRPNLTCSLLGTPSPLV